MKNNILFIFAFATMLNCSSCLMTRNLEVSRTKSDIIFNYEQYISAFEWLCENGFVVQSESSLDLYDSFIAIKLAVTSIEEKEIELVLTDPVFIEITDAGERLVKKKNNLSRYLFFKRLGNGLGEIGRSMSSSTYR